MQDLVHLIPADPGHIAPGRPSTRPGEHLLWRHHLKGVSRATRSTSIKRSNGRAKEVTGLPMRAAISAMR
jgi:hypothetical protein